MRFDAPTFARAWLAVAQATGGKDDIAQFARTVAVEEFPTGVRLVATDRFILLTAWVPDLNARHPRTPHLSELPDRTVITYDGDGRVKSLMAYALTVAKRADSDGSGPAGMTEVRVTFDERKPVDKAGDATLDGLELKYVVFDLPDVERVWAQIVEAQYPTWQPLVLDHHTQDTKAIALNPEFVGRLVKASQHAEGPIVWTFGGADRVALVEWPDSDPNVSGLIMPRRWYLPGEEPEEDTEPLDGTEPGDQPGEGDPEDAVPATSMTSEDATLMASAVELVVSTQFGSARMIARKLNVGQDKARAIMDQLEHLGIVGPAEGTKSRDVLVNADQFEEVIRRLSAPPTD